MAPCNESLITLGDEAVNQELPVLATLTYHHLGLIISAVFGLLATIIGLCIILNHATHYSKPQEQRYIIRILAMIPIYAIISFVSYWQFRYAIYWQVIRDCYEAIAIASFFSLLSHYVAPTIHDQKDWARQLQPKNWVLPINWMQKCTGGQDKGLFRRPRSGLTWYNVVFVGVFQYCFFRIFFTFVAMISQFFNRYCESSNNPEYAHIWVLSFEALSVTIAMYCLIQFFVQVKGELASHRPLLKVSCIKLVIFFSFWQNLVISFLASSRGGSQAILHPTEQLAYPDIIVGIPSMLLCIEMFLFSILHIFAFPVKGEYDLKSINVPNAYYQGGFLGWRAMMDAIIMWDLVKASARGFRWLFVGMKRREQDVSYQMGRNRSADTGYEGYRENVKLENAAGWTPGHQQGDYAPHDDERDAVVKTPAGVLDSQQDTHTYAQAPQYAHSHQEEGYRHSEDGTPKAYAYGHTQTATMPDPQDHNHIGMAVTSPTMARGSSWRQEDETSLLSKAQSMGRR